MKHNKILIFVLLLSLFSTGTSLAAPMQSVNEYFKNSYSVVHMDFEDAKEYDWAEKSKGAALSGSAARITKDVNLIGSEFAGKTYFGFEFIADSIETGFSAVMGNNEERKMVFSAFQNGENLRLCINGETAGTVLAGEKVYAELLADTVNKTAQARLSTNSKVIYENNALTLTAQTENISEIGFRSDSGHNVYVDNIDIKREQRAFSEQPVITKCGNKFSAEAKTPENCILYLAQFRNNKLVNMSLRKSESDYTEVFMEDNSEQGDVFKAFLWNEELVPQTLQNVIKRNDVNFTELVLDGNITAGERTEGESVRFDCTFPAGYSDGEIIISRDGSKCAELSSGETWLCGESGDYTAWLYVKDGGALIPCAKYDFFVYPKLTDDDTFIFPAEKPYYVHNGQRRYYTSDGFVPLIADGNVYLSNDIIRQISGIEITDEKAFYKGESIADLADKAQINGVYAFNDIAAGMGYSAQLKEDILYVSKSQETVVCDVTFDYIMKDSLDGNQKAWNNLYYPYNWGFYDWANSNQGSGFGACFDDKTDGENSVYINAAENKGSGYAAYTYKLSECDLKGYLYAVSFDVKYSGNLSGNIPFAALSFNSENGFMGHLHGTAVTGKTGEWTRVTSYFTREALDKYSGFSDVSLLVGVKATNSVTAGKIYFDNVSMREVSILNEASEAEIVCNEFAAWHKNGETVSYSPQDEKLYGFDKITGVVYNMDNEKVYENTVSVRQFYENGWKYVPDKLGYYEAEFYGTRSDGTKSLIVNCYTSAEGNSYTAYGLARHSFAVVEGEAKPMEERPDFLLISDSAKNPEHLKMINMLGFSGVRIHGIAWGSTAAEKGFEPSKGNFDWTNADTQVNNTYNAGFGNIIANVFATPVWAVNNDEDNGYNMVGWYYKNCYKADDNNDIANAYGAFAERYRDKISGIEVWNEPHYGRTAFWCDTPNNFAELAKTAYDAVKSKAPELSVYSAGFNQATALFDELMRKENFRNAFDAISFHGRYEDDAEYRRILGEHGMSDVPIINSEGYFYAYYQKNTPKNFRLNNMQMYMCYLDHLKNNDDMAGIFEITENNPDEKRAAGISGHTMGLFRAYPYYEPRQGAVTAYNLFKNLGKEISFLGEYDFGGGRKAAAIKSDGEVQIYLWNADDEDFALPDELEACMNENSSIIDFEGNAADINSLNKQRVYCIRNASAQETANLKITEGCAFNGDYEAPFYTCRNAYGETIEDYTPDEGVFTEGRLFSRTDFSEEDKPQFNNGGFVWKPSDNADYGISAEYAVSAANDGLYIIVKTKGDTNKSYADNAEKLADADGIRIGIDCYGRLRAAERAEFFVGYVKNTAQSKPVPTLYKYNAAEVYQAIPEEWSPSKTVMDSSFADITDSGNETTYKIYLPYTELYPFVYRTSNKKNLRLSISVSDADNGVKQGDLCFGAGLAEDNPRVWKYGLLREYGMASGINIYSENGTIYINGKTSSNLITTVFTKEDGSIIYLDQINNAAPYYSKQLAAEPGVKYTVAINDENRNAFAKTVTAE